MVNRQGFRSLGLRMGRSRSLSPSPEDLDGVRRPQGAPPAPKAGWEGYLVAQKPVGLPWPPSKLNAINEARRQFDAGTHIMTTCTTPEGWTQLYCRPRREPVSPKPYFTETRS